jgi:hypothetical protein
MLTPYAAGLIAWNLDATEPLRGIETTSNVNDVAIGSDGTVVIATETGSSRLSGAMRA